MEKLQAAGLIYGPQMHHLDHIAVLCILMDVPLIVTEPTLEEIAQKYYPQLVVFCFDYPEIGEKVVREYDVIFSSLPRDLFDQIFFVAENMQRKKLISIWCPHGNSDKGHMSYFMEGLCKEKIALVYGQKMIDFLIEKKVYSQLYATVVMGNFRYHFYKECAPFYDKLIQKEIASKLTANNRTLFYAPTWEDAENSCSLFHALPELIETIPEHWNLIVKPHPNTLEKPQKLEALIHQTEKRPNILFLKTFPPIYPLLNFVDAYLGDMSSIGYDFLTFKKPLFFLNQNKRDPKTDKGLYLYQCGPSIEPDDYPLIFSKIEARFSSKEKPFQKISEEVYSYVFGTEKNPKELRTTIEEIYGRYHDEQLPFL